MEKTPGKLLGITGGIGAGKSTVLACLKERYGAYVIQADEVARSLQQPGGPCYDRITEAFGSCILQPDGMISRNTLASIVFSDPRRLRILNQIVHPAVRQWILDETTRQRQKGTLLTVIEAALLLEERYDQICDEVWYIRAAPPVRIQRLMESRGYTREKAKQIMENQLSDEQYKSRCRRTIDNSGGFLTDTLKQIDEAMAAFGIPLSARTAPDAEKPAP